MDITEQKEIRLVVEDEKTLYSSFSPEAEFSEPIKHTSGQEWPPGTTVREST